MVIKTVSDFRKAVRLPYAWPGGYPTYFVCEDYEPLCHKCVKKNRRLVLEAVARPKYRDGWRVIGLEINYEDDNLDCVNCSNAIESAYGNT